MKTNYHTHTYRCNHAKGSDEEYVKAAIEGGFSLLGFSDHVPWSADSSTAIRMHRDELEGYVSSVELLREKYSNEIEIKIGLEAEYYAAHIDWLRYIKAVYSLDFMLFGNHFIYSECGLSVCEVNSDEKLNLYLNSSIEGLRSGVFDAFAHPDIYMRNYEKPTQYCIDIFREIAIAARELDIPLERNLRVPFFIDLWKEVAYIQPKVIIGVDAHNPNALLDTQAYEDNYNIIKHLGLNPLNTLK